MSALLELVQQPMHPVMVPRQGFGLDNCFCNQIRSGACICRQFGPVGEAYYNSMVERWVFLEVAPSTVWTMARLLL
jgi:hypothetical protein